jgi:hypothetical protein
MVLPLGTQRQRQDEHVADRPHPLAAALIGAAARVKGIAGMTDVEKLRTGPLSRLHRSGEGAEPEVSVVVWVEMIRVAGWRERSRAGHRLRSPG